MPAAVTVGYRRPGSVRGRQPISGERGCTTFRDDDAVRHVDGSNRSPAGAAAHPQGAALIYPLTFVVELAPAPVLQPKIDLPALIESLRKFQLGSGTLENMPQKLRDALDAESNCLTFSLDDVLPEDFDPEQTVRWQP